MGQSEDAPATRAGDRKSFVPVGRGRLPIRTTAERIRSRRVVSPRTMLAARRQLIACKLIVPKERGSTEASPRMATCNDSTVAQVAKPAGVAMKRPLKKDTVSLTVEEAEIMSPSLVGVDPRNTNARVQVLALVGQKEEVHKVSEPFHAEDVKKECQWTTTSSTMAINQDVANQGVPVICDGSLKKGRVSGELWMPNEFQKLARRGSLDSGNLTLEKRNWGWNPNPQGSQKTARLPRSRSMGSILTKEKQNLKNRWRVTKETEPQLTLRSPGTAALKSLGNHELDPGGRAQAHISRALDSPMVTRKMIEQRKREALFRREIRIVEGDENILTEGICIDDPSCDPFTFSRWLLKLKPRTWDPRDAVTGAMMKPRLLPDPSAHSPGETLSEVKRGRPTTFQNTERKDNESFYQPRLADLAAESTLLQQRVQEQEKSILRLKTRLTDLKQAEEQVIIELLEVDKTLQKLDPQIQYVRSDVADIIDKYVWNPPGEIVESPDTDGSIHNM